jgi:DNA-binding NtrC family response regulator
MAGAETTVPTRSPRASEPAVARLAIRWMFPKTPGPTTFLDTDAVIGRDPDGCTVHLEGSEISRRHAEVVRKGTTAAIRDLGSRNGTHVNGARITEETLSPGDVVRLGEWVGVVCSVADPDPGFSVLPGGFVKGPRLAERLAAAEATADSGLPVVIVGETGTGKELAARAIHVWSRRKGPFVPVNCALLTDPALAANLLFGHERGSFTSADQRSEGYLRRANHGTLFLDEVADLPLSVQPTLLRALQDGEVQRIGEDAAPMRVSLKVLVAAQAPLQLAVDERRFRGDLLARLDGVSVHLPPLRERREDIPYVRSWHAAKAGAPGPKPTAEFVEGLCLYDWPYNVRQLTQTLTALTALHSGEPTLEKHHLEAHLGGRGSERRAAPTPSNVPPSNVPPSGTRDERELAALVDSLRAHAGNVTAAARAVGLSRARAYRLLGHEDVDPDRFRDATQR